MLFEFAVSEGKIEYKKWVCVLCFPATRNWQLKAHNEETKTDSGEHTFQDLFAPYKLIWVPSAHPYFIQAMASSGAFTAKHTLLMYALLSWNIKLSEYFQRRLVDPG